MKIKLSGITNTVKEFAGKPAVKTTIAVAIGLGLAFALNSCKKNEQTQPDANNLQSITDNLKRQIDDIKKELEN